jgi:hypothetical protein
MTVTTTSTKSSYSDTSFIRSTAMYTMNEAFARERLHEVRERAEQHRLHQHAAAARRWSRLERLAHSASVRHERQARAAAATTA